MKSLLALVLLVAARTAGADPFLASTYGEPCDPAMPSKLFPGSKPSVALPLMHERGLYAFNKEYRGRDAAVVLRCDRPAGKVSSGSLTIGALSLEQGRRLMLAELKELERVRAAKCINSLEWTGLQRLLRGMFGRALPDGVEAMALYRLRGKVDYHLRVEQSATSPKSIQLLIMVSGPTPNLLDQQAKELPCGA